MNIGTHTVSQFLYMTKAWITQSGLIVHWPQHYYCYFLCCRHLDHKNIAKFFGAMKVNVSYQSSEHKFLFVRQFYKENLKSVIFNDENKTPAKASNTGQAIIAFLKWAIEIADGLMYSPREAPNSQTSQAGKYFGWYQRWFVVQ